MSSVQIENVAAVERLHFNCPEGGGVVVLTGDNGAGKSKTLEAVDAILGGDTGGLQKRDLSVGGMVDGFGVTIRVGHNRHRKSGELTVSSLDDRLSIADLVDPNIKDPAAADRHRLKALLTVCDVKADLDLFRDLVPDGDVRAIASPTTLEQADIVAMAGRLKRDFEAKARTAEDVAKNKATEAAALLDTIRDVDLGAPADVDSAQQQLDAARREADQLEFRVKSATAAAQRRADALRDLQAAEASYAGPTVDEAEAIGREWCDKVDLLAGKVKGLESQLSDAREELRDAKVEEKATADRHTAALNHANLCAGWRKTIETGEAASMPEAARLEAAKEAVELAKKAVANAGIVARARKQEVQAALLVGEANTAAELAARLRQAAGGTDEVLTAAVQRMGGAIRIGPDDKGNARLLVTHPKRGETYFSELSLGERWTLVLPIAIAAVGPGGVFTIRQEAWEGLSPANRRRLANALVGSGVTAITAQADDGPIRAEVFGDEGGAR